MLLQLIVGSSPAPSDRIGARVLAAASLATEQVPGAPDIWFDAMTILAVACGLPRDPAALVSWSRLVFGDAYLQGFTGYTGEDSESDSPRYALGEIDRERIRQATPLIAELLKRARVFADSRDAWSLSDESLIAKLPEQPDIKPLLDQLAAIDSITSCNGLN